MLRTVILVAAVVLAACTSTAKISHTWVAEDIADKDLHGVLVVAIAEQEDSRREFERRFTDALTRKSVRAVASYELKPGASISKEDVIALSARENLDTVLVTTFAGRDHQQVLHAGRTYYSVSPIYRRGYYGHGRVYAVPYQVHHTPDFWAQHKSLHLEANLYAVTTEEHLWRAAAGIEESDDINAMRDAFIDAFMTELSNQQLLD